ncbi:hypothetical protein NNJEOMEG_03844 [Fundidesulfovibrio magnetotacticus]|uniref:Uncharacterized protein n=1 Tax=Fundidesulfovibrio magnetotacticus TaxID=2730080 RepID=A0A6V8LZJ4_9BACT|nr:hypothetical protein [Fundidesulfovibrio magnetotacticus]GFK95971.1 hypothetical protein NNJEOMEG_03844 [Fundidesulfovibrio magnetotacticus]
MPHPFASSLAVLAVLLLSCAAAHAQPFETPPTFKAQSLLPKDLLSGPDFRVDPEVRNDGYLNIYVIHSPYGDFKAASTALARTRIAEIRAMSKMDQVAGSNAFASSLADKGKQTLQGAVDLVTDPLQTLGGALSGVGKLFVRAQENLAESSPSKWEDSRAAGLVGFSKTKRDYALRFGVDPYSTNPVLQQKLDALSEAGYAGSLTGTALQALIPGGVGIAVSGVSTTALMQGVDLTVPPGDLRRQNREALIQAGVPKDLARLFVNNPEFTPTQQTVLTRALTSMAGTADKAEFVEFVAETSDQDVCLFRQRMAEMYAGYAREAGALARFVPVGRFVGALRPDGRLVLAFPLDYLAYTAAAASNLDALDRAARALPASGVELWLTGKASPGTKQRLKRMGWTLREDAAGRLGM